MRCILFSFKNKLITNPCKFSGKTSARCVCACVVLWAGLITQLLNFTIEPSSSSFPVSTSFAQGVCSSSKSVVYSPAPYIWVWPCNLLRRWDVSRFSTIRNLKCTSMAGLSLLDFHHHYEKDMPHARLLLVSREWENHGDDLEATCLWN